MVIELKEPGREPERRQKEAKENELNARGGMRCPVCDVPLSMSERQGVEVDFCMECRGVWLDRGELDKIVERSSREFAVGNAPGYDNTMPRDYDGHGNHGGHGSHKQRGYRRKSWLHELFDCPPEVFLAGSSRRAAEG